MLHRLRQWCPNRLPLRPLSLIFSKHSTSAAATLSYEPTSGSDGDSDSTATSASTTSPNPNDPVREILYGLRIWGTTALLGDSYFRSVLPVLSSQQVDWIIECLGIDDPELAVWFFNALRRDYGFRHSRVSVLAVSQVLARERRTDELRETLSQLTAEEGSGSAPSICDLICDGSWKWDFDRIVWDMLALCYSASGMVQDALYVLAKMKDLNLRVSAYTYNSLLHNLRHTDSMWNVYDEMKASGGSRSQYTNSILIDGMCRQSMLLEAAEHLQETECGQNNPCVVSFNTLMSGFVREGFLDVAKSFFCMMLKYGLLPDAYSYNILIHGLCVAGCVEEALDFAEDMQNHGVEPDTVTYNTLAKGFYLLGLIGSSQQVIEKMVLKGLDPDLVTYVILMCGHCREGNLDEGLRLHQEMLSKGFMPNVITYSVLVSSLFKYRQLDKVKELLEQMKIMQVEPDIVLYSILIHGFCKLGEVQQALYLYKDMLLRGILPNSFSHANVLLCLFHKEMVGEARTYFDSLTKDAVPVDIVLYNIMINGYVKRNRIRDAVELYQRIVSTEGISPTIVTFNSLIYGFCRSGRIGDARRCFKMINMHGLLPNAITYTTLMNAHCEVGDMHAMIDLLTEMETKNVPPNHVTYTVLIKGLCKQRRYQEAVQRLPEMYAMGLFPDQITYNTIIQSFCEAQDMKSAVHLLDEMLRLGLNPSPVTYNILINGLCSYSDLNSADTLLSSLQNQDIRMTKVAYMTVIKAHCVKGDVHRSLLLFHQMLHMGFDVSLKDFSAIVNRLCKRHLYAEAKVYVCLMLAMDILPDLKLVNVLNQAKG